MSSSSYSSNAQPGLCRPQLISDNSCSGVSARLSRSVMCTSRGNCFGAPLLLLLLSLPLAAAASWLGGR